MRLDGFRVTTGCRIHFGLMELCRTEPNCFAGLGLMLETPGFEIQLAYRDLGQSSERKFEPIVTFRNVAPADDEQSELRKRVLAVCQRYSKLYQTSVPVQCFDFVEWLPLHHGLGAGTQLACGVASGLARARFNWISQSRSQMQDPFSADPSVETGQLSLGSKDPFESLATLSGRGLRSGIGVSGFLTGGFILDHGYSAAGRDAASHEEHLASRGFQADSVSLPPSWRVILLFADSRKTVHGRSEADILGAIGQNPNPDRVEMQTVAGELLKIATSSSISEFAALLDVYMELASRLFHSKQGGVYSSSEIRDAAELAKSCGLHGVGQSSWGPVVFGFCESDTQARSVVAEVRNRGFQGRIQVATPEPQRSFGEQLGAQERPSKAT